MQMLFQILNELKYLRIELNLTEISKPVFVLLKMRAKEKK